MRKKHSQSSRVAPLRAFFFIAVKKTKEKQECIIWKVQINQWMNTKNIHIMNTCLLHVENAENCSDTGFSTPGVDSSFTARRRCTTDAAKVLCLNLDLIAKIMYPVMILKMVPRGEKKQTENTLFLSVFPRNQLLLIYLSVLKVIA